MVPLALLVMLVMRRSSIATIAWFLLIVALAWCRQALRMFTIREYSFVTRPFALRQLAENFTLWASRRYRNASRCSCFRNA